jgi:hypothetical protein
MPNVGCQISPPDFSILVLPMVLTSVCHICKKTKKGGNDNKKTIPKIITNDDVKNVLRNDNIK